MLSWVTKLYFTLLTWTFTAHLTFVPQNNNICWNCINEAIFHLNVSNNNWTQLQIYINIYHNRWCWHLHYVHSCGPRTLDVCSLLSMVPFLNKWRRPTRWVHCPVQNVHVVVLNEPCHSPAVCTPHWHLSDPSGHHTLSPTVQHGRSPLCQSSGCQSWPASLVKQLRETHTTKYCWYRHRWKRDFNKTRISIKSPVIHYNTCHLADAFIQSNLQ